MKKCGFTIHYSWIVCAGCTLLLFCTMGLTSSGFSVYMPYLVKVGDLTSTQGSAIITIRSLFSMIALLPAQRIYEKVGLRVGAMLSVLGAAIGMTLFGISDSFAGYCCSAAAIGIVNGIGGMYLVSLIIPRWFTSYASLALGICSAGSAIAATIIPPVITAIIQKASLRIAFFAEAWFLAVSAVTVYGTIRGSPIDKGIEAFKSTDEHLMSKETIHGNSMSPVIEAIMVVAFFVMHGCTYSTYHHLSLLYSRAGFASVTISYLLSISGLILVLGKFLLGFFADVKGLYRTGYLFFGILFIGCVLCAFADYQIVGLAVISVIFLGFGLAIGTVGVSLYAKKMSAENDYPVTLKRFQLACQLGALAFSPIPGVICDLTGSYTLGYALFGGLIVMVLSIFQICYTKTCRATH